jgi:hypothetical protein
VGSLFGNESSFGEPTAARRPTAVCRARECRKNHT